MRWMFMVVWATLLGALGIGVAASLTLDTDDLGAGGSVVSSCDRSVDVVLVPDADAPERVVAVEVAGISRVACLNHRVDVLVWGDGDVMLDQRSGTVRTTSVRLDLAEPVDAATITGVDVVITQG